MAKFKSFDDIRTVMTNPLDNLDFYAMLIGDTRYKGMVEDIGAFSICHNYELGSTTHESWFDLWRLAIKEYLDNITYQEFKKRYPNSTEEQFQSINRMIQKLSKSHQEFSNWTPGNIDGLKKILGVGSKSIDEENKTPRSVGWFYFRSRTLNPGDEQAEINTGNVKHRLYLTVDSEDRAKMASRIIEKCKERRLPYEFKVHINFKKKKQNQQSDTIVIYLSEEEQVVEYVNFINEILEEDKDLKAHTHKASPHLGIIDEYIGYGFEPQLEGSRKSYSQLLKKATSGCDTKKMAISIFSFLADKNARRRYDGVTPEGMRVYKPSEWEDMKLETPERYGELLEIIKRGEATSEEYEMIRKCLAGYFKRENMDVDEIHTLRDNISRRLVEAYPQLPEDNMFNIDVDEIKYEMNLDEEEWR